MDWTAIGTGVAIVALGYAFLRNLKIDILSIKTELRKEMGDMKSELKKEMAEIKVDIHSIDQRLSRLEGSFTERGNWESRIYVESKNIRNQHAQTHPSQTHRRRGHR